MLMMPQVLEIIKQKIIREIINGLHNQIQFKKETLSTFIIN